MGNNNGKVMVGLSLRQARLLARMVSAADHSFYDPALNDYKGQCAHWYLGCDIESAIKYAMGEYANKMGYDFGAGYGLAQKWLDEPMYKGFGSAFRKGA